MSARNIQRRLHTNGLIDETSPYLLQHAHNPVDWYPWGDEALMRAHSEHKPIFLSIGYAACHWCHVMERESFENDQIAALLNEHFISIKVDREERPDVDEIYMTAVQIMTGSGGWPMSVFLTPDLKPFYAGTYFPPEDTFGRPGFATVLRSVAATWDRQPNDVVRSAEEITRVVQGHMKGHAAPDGQLDARLFDKTVGQLRDTFDPREGGFGGAPKFPPSGAIALLLRRHVHTRDTMALSMATRTLDKMARGGLYDQLGGGFHRYATDAEWLVPHFEKMLYDNALLAQAYLEGYQLTRNPLYRRIASDTLDYVLRDMTDPAGGFHSSEDADSDGQEGMFYLWTRDEIMSGLGEEAGRIFCAYYQVLDEGNFASHEPYHARQNILHVPRDPGEVAAELGISENALEISLENSRASLLAVRNRRVRPGRDDKVLTSWNGLMISALAQGCQVTSTSRYGTAAERAAEFILAHMTRDGELLRTYRNGQSRLPGFLDDYACFLAALIDLYETTFDVRWIAAANDLANGMITRFWDDQDGCFYSTTEAHPHLIVRSKPSFDGAEPSGNSVAALALLRLARFTGSSDYEGRARRIIEGHAAAMSRAPQAFLRMLCAADFLLYPGCEIAVVGDRQNPQTAALLGALRNRFIPNKIVAAVDPANVSAPEAIARIPLLRDKRPVPGHVGAYVCRDFACHAPVTTPEALSAELDQVL